METSRKFVTEVEKNSVAKYQEDSSVKDLKKCFVKDQKGFSGKYQKKILV